MSTRTRRENNFNIIRFVAALMVMAGHMAYICGGELPILWAEGIQALGVKIFFLVGGFLISKSWLSDSSPKRYIIKRVIRIFPALIVYCVITTYIIGPILTNIPIKEYFKNPDTVLYLKNILLFPIYSLPGVFTQNPYPNAVNGSLWTLPVECALYVIVPIVITILNVKKKDNRSLILLSIWTIFLCIFQVVRSKYFPEYRLVIYGTDTMAASELIPWYFVGIIYTYPCVQKYLNIQIAIILMLVFSCLPSGMMLGSIIKYFVFSYLIFSFALAKEPMFANTFRRYEISYGIYLYSFLIQQIVVYGFKQMRIGLGQIWVFLICVMITSFVGVLSTVFIEIPAQKISAKLLNKIGNNKND